MHEDPMISFNSQCFAHSNPQNMILVTSQCWNTILSTMERGGGYGDVYSVSRFIYTRTVADPNP